MNFLLIGEAGSGKTTAACSGRKPAFMIDVDGKAKQMVNLKPLIESGDLIIYPILDKMVKDRLRARAEFPDRPPAEMPEGYLHIVDILNNIIDGDPEYAKYKTIILDSATRVKEHMIKLLVYHRGKGKMGKNPDDDMNRPSWASYLSNFVELFDAIKYIEDKDFICTVHLKTVEKTTVSMIGSNVVESTEVTGYKPLIDGQFREQMAGYFNECYYMDHRKPKEYRFRTAGNYKYDARTSMPLDEFEPASIEHVLKKGEIW